jgi:hypothetical protein
LLEVEGDRANTLSKEVDLLNQDNKTLEEQLEELRLGRSKVNQKKLCPFAINSSTY